MLREAVASIEKGANILEKRQRSTPLTEVLINAMTFYATLNENDQALRIGNKLREQGERSEVMLRNLFMLQLRNGKENEALETAKAMIESGLEKEGELRQAQALIALGRFEPILVDYEKHVAADTLIYLNDDWISIFSQAWSMAQKREKALTLLDEYIALRPGKSILRLEKALVLEGLGRKDEAAREFEIAEKTEPTSGQVAVDYGLFLYRREQWSEALSRLEKVGAASILNPLFKEYLISLYNTRNIEQTFDLIREWKKAERGYEEAVYALGARCALIYEDLPCAKMFLGELLRHGSHADSEHRKQLAQVSLRLDEQEEAYNFLSRLLADKSDDAGALVLMTQVCIARGRYSEALTHIQKAIQVDEKNYKAREVFFSTMLALPKDFVPTSQCIDAHQNNLAALTSQPSGALRAINITPDLGEIREMLQKREKHVESVVKETKSQSVPFGFLAVQTGTSYYDVWRTDISNSDRGVHMCHGSAETQGGQIDLAGCSDAISVDLLTLFTLQELRVLEVLPKMFRNIFAHISLLDAIVAQLHQLRYFPKDGGKVATHKGQLYFTPNDPAQDEQSVIFLTTIRDFLKSRSVQLVGLKPEIIKDKNLAQLPQACGDACILPIFVAYERGAALLSDDLLARVIGEAGLKVKGFCTQAFLRVARTRNIITNSEYHDNVLKLLEMNYHFVADEVGTLIRLYEKTRSNPSAIAELLIRRAGNPLFDQNTTLVIISSFLDYLWTIPTESLRFCRDPWAKLIWMTLAEADTDGKILDKFLSFLAARLISRPGSFMGILVWAIRNVGTLNSD